MITKALAQYTPAEVLPEEWNLRGLLAWAESLFLPPRRFTADALAAKEREELFALLYEAAAAVYEEREAKLGAEGMRELERIAVLRAVDLKWMNHIDAMDMLRHEIGLRAYGQRDPLVEYKFEAKNMFDQMIEEIQEEAVWMLYRVQLAAPLQRQAVAVANETPDGQGAAVQKPAAAKKVGRNAPCPCGSGKKYKKCCGK
jgi:preprotein translocase subunit SecA